MTSGFDRSGGATEIDGENKGLVGKPKKILDDGESPRWKEFTHFAKGTKTAIQREEVEAGEGIRDL